MIRPVVQMFTFAAAILFVTSGCAPGFVAPANPEQVRLELHDSPRETKLYAERPAPEQGTRGHAAADLPICTTSPCETSVPGGSVLYADGNFPSSRRFQLPATGAVKVHVEPGSSVGQALSTVGIFTGDAAILASVGLVVAGLADDCNCAERDRLGAFALGTFVVGSAVFFLSEWAYRRSSTVVTVEPVVRF